jgi:hypothetical protein
MSRPGPRRESIPASNKRHCRGSLCRMAAPVGRSEKRIKKMITVELARSDAPQLKETAITQNLSSRGMCVATKRFWRPGDRITCSRNPASASRHASFIVTAWKKTVLLWVWNSWIRQANAPSAVSSLRESCRKFMCGRFLRLTAPPGLSR